MSLQRQPLFFPTTVILFTVFLVQFVVSTAGTACYRVNGQEGSEDIQPCHSNLTSGSHSACCNLGKSPPDLCLAGGLCYRQDGYDGNFLIYAVSCTDSSGADAACQQYCSAGGSTAMYSLNACFDGRWCCNSLTTSESCCDPNTGNGIFSLTNILSLDPTPSAKETVLVSTIASTTVTQTMTTSSQGSASRVNGTPQSNAETCSKDTAVVVGASIGAAAGGFIIAVLISYLFMARFMGNIQRRQEQQQQQSQMQTWGTSTNLPFGQETAWRHEMDTKNMPVESARYVPNAFPPGTATDVPHEIDSTGRAELR